MLKRRQPTAIVDGFDTGHHSLSHSIFMGALSSARVVLFSSRQRLGSSSIIAKLSQVTDAAPTVKMSDVKGGCDTEGDLDPVLENYIVSHAKRKKSQRSHTSHGEFDPGSGRTLAACLIHASRAVPRQRDSGGRVRNT